MSRVKHTIPRNILLVSAYFTRVSALVHILRVLVGVVAFPTPRRQHDLNLRPMQMHTMYIFLHTTWESERVKGLWWYWRQLLLAHASDVCVYVWVLKSQNFNYHLEHAITPRPQPTPSARSYYFHVTLKTDCKIKRNPKTGPARVMEKSKLPKRHTGRSESGNIGVLTQEDWKDLRAGVMSWTTAAV